MRAELANWRSALKFLWEKRFGDQPEIPRGEVLDRWAQFDADEGLRPAW